jgi:hypothetical protein
MAAAAVAGLTQPGAAVEAALEPVLLDTQVGMEEVISLVLRHLVGAAELDIPVAAGAGPIKTVLTEQTGQVEEVLAELPGGQIQREAVELEFWERGQVVHQVGRAALVAQMGRKQPLGRPLAQQEVHMAAAAGANIVAQVALALA